MPVRVLVPCFLSFCLGVVACRRPQEAPSPPEAADAGSARASPLTVGLVTDIGGRGDGSFNDSALRGLELWAAGKRPGARGYVDAAPEVRRSSLPPGLLASLGGVPPLPIVPVVLQSKAQEDYEPNLQLLVERGAALAIGVGFMLENAVEAVARANPKARFLLVDSPLLDAAGRPLRLPNVRTVVFREEEGSFLVGALAGLVTRSGRVAFVGGMQIPLIRKFEAGFRAGVLTTNPAAARRLLTAYTGSFDKVAAGKQVAQDLLAKGVDVVFHAAGSDGLGVIQAVKEARAAGRQAYVIGVDSDQSPIAPEAVLTSMVKRVDVAVYQAAQDLSSGRFTAEDQVLGLEQEGVGFAPVRVEFPDKPQALERLEALRRQIVSGELRIPATLEDLSAFGAPP